jgi:hypothetical protein
MQRYRWPATAAPQTKAGRDDRGLLITITKFRYTLNPQPGSRHLVAAIPPGADGVVLKGDRGLI